MKTRALPVVGLSLLVLTLVGCSGSKGPAHIEGKVTCKGTPLPGQTLVLFSEGGAGEFSAYRFVLQPDGSFSGTVPSPGQYQVAIEEAMAVQEGTRQPDRSQPTVPRKYRSRQESGLTWTIEAGDNKREFDLTD
jgi:hypothetical protein